VNITVYTRFIAGVNVLMLYKFSYKPISFKECLLSLAAFKLKLAQVAIKALFIIDELKVAATFNNVAFFYYYYFICLANG
jgi:hypothetical protein